VIVQVTRTTLLPVLVCASDPQLSPADLTEEFLGDLAVGYTPGPPYGHRLVTWEELDDLGMPQRELRRRAASNLYAALDRVGVHGQPPALMLSFEGLESSVLLAHAFWDDLAGSVPGELVAGTPARDVVIFTGAQSGSGLQKVRRAVDRVVYAGGPHLLSRDLLVRRQRRWEVFDPRSYEPSPIPAPTSPPVSGAPRMVPRPRTPMSSGPAR
jgi:uncharacterized protein YtpQ (UPF0354 family)